MPAQQKDCLPFCQRSAFSARIISLKKTAGLFKIAHLSQLSRVALTVITNGGHCLRQSEKRGGYNSVFHGSPLRHASFVDSRDDGSQGSWRGVTRNANCN